jgi:hypothetical protein
MGYEEFVKKKKKGIPVIGRGGPQGCVTLRLPHFLDNRLTDSGEVVSLMRRPPFAPGRFLALICVRSWVDPGATVRLERLGQLKNPMTSSRIKLATFWLVAQCLNQLRYRVPLWRICNPHTLSLIPWMKTIKLFFMELFQSATRTYSTELCLICYWFAASGVQSNNNDK